MHQKHSQDHVRISVWANFKPLPEYKRLEPTFNIRYFEELVAPLMNYFAEQDASHKNDSQV
jgi:hypothetical protein